MYSKILVAVDGGEASNRAVTEAVALARALNAEIRLIHVVDATLLTSATGAVSSGPFVEALRRAGTTLLHDSAAVATAAGVRVDTMLPEYWGASVGECVVQNALQCGAELIVCGTHGRRGLRRLLMGSDAEYIVRHASIPVLLVRAANEGRDAKSPVMDSAGVVLDKAG